MPRGKVVLAPERDPIRWLSDIEVIAAFSIPSNRSAVLRTKVEMSKTADMRSISVGVGLNAEQQLTAAAEECLVAHVHAGQM